MKIRRIHTQVAVMSKDHKYSFDIKEHKLEFIQELLMFKIDETLVPMSNIREVLLEESVSVNKNGGVVITNTNSELTSHQTDSNKEELPSKNTDNIESSEEIINEIITQVKRTRKK